MCAEAHKLNMTPVKAGAHPLHEVVVLTSAPAHTARAWLRTAVTPQKVDARVGARLAEGQAAKCR